jgi:hypothetical protein
MDGIGCADEANWLSGPALNYMHLNVEYLGPCLTPAEVSALVEAARRDEREACAEACMKRARAWESDPFERAGAYRNEAECCAAAIRAPGDATKDTGRLNDCGGSDSCCQGPCKARY